MAPNKKYLSLEEAAKLLGIKTDELVRLREKGDVRGFADRGTWKFKADDVEEFRRRRQPDSDPDLQIIDDLDSSDDDEVGRRGTVIRKGSTKADSDSDVRMMMDDINRNPLSGSSADLPAFTGTDSDSDVRLVEPSALSGDASASDVTLVIPNSMKKSDSDSDVRLIDKPSSGIGLNKTGRGLDDSDSDVRLASTDSDIRLSPFSDSDSDVKLIGPKGKAKSNDSDSEVTLAKSSSRSGGRDDSSIALAADSGIRLSDDSGIRLSDNDSGISLGGDSGIALAGDSGIRLSPGGDSGIRLGASSGIRLGGDSGIRLADDSGVQLKQPADSGISLEGRDSGLRLGDSGIALGNESGLDLEGSGKTFDLLQESSVTKRAAKGGSSKKLRNTAPRTEEDLATTLPMDLDDDLSSTAPLLRASDLDDESASELDMFDPSATSELESLDDSSQNVVMFEDDEDSSPAPKRKPQKTVEESIFEVEDGADEEIDELEVSDEDLSGEDDIDDLAFDDDDVDHEDSFSEGSSSLGFGSSKRVPVAQEVEWSAQFCSLLMASLLLMAAGTWVSADLLRTVWAGPGDSAIYPGFAAQIGSLWKK